MGTKKKNKKTLFGFGFTMLFAAVVFIFQAGMPNKTYGADNGNGKIKQHSYNPMQLVQQPDNAKDEEPIDFYKVEEKPVFPGGEKAFYKYLSNNIKYPETAMKNKIQGTVWVKFIIEKDGSISNVKVIRDANPDLNKEALRVIKSMPNWKPGKQNGKPVRVSYQVPIRFSLN